MTWEGLNPPYATIVADPPWAYDEGWPGWGRSRIERRALPYSSMGCAAVAELPVGDLAEREGYLFLWTTNRYLEQAFGVVRSWTFTPRQVVTWCKEPVGVGPGGMFATTTEFIIVAQRIKEGTNAHSRRTTGRVETSWFNWPRGAHSEKPAAFYDLVERVSPGPYVELFARQPRLGWDHWGFGYEEKVS